MKNTLIKIKNKLIHNQNGAIDATLMTIIGIFLAATCMYIIPVMSMAEKNDKIAQTVWDTATSEFVDTVSNAGMIRPSFYQELQQKVDSVGVPAEITIEIQHLDNNVGKKSALTSGNIIGENITYTTYTSEIVNYMFPSGEDVDNMLRNYPLKKGDNIIVTVKNRTNTLAQQLRSFVFKVTGKGTYELSSSKSSMVVNTGNVNS